MATAISSFIGQYGPGLFNTNLGSAGTSGLFSAATDRKKEIARLQTIFDRLTTHIQYYSLPTPLPLESNDETQIIKWLNGIKDGLLPAEINIGDQETQQKYLTTLNRYQTFVSKRLKQERSAQKIDRGNQVSFFFQAIQGMGQIAQATGRVGPALTALGALVTGFSLISSLFYLGASVYGVISFSEQLSKNRAAQLDLIVKLNAHTPLEGDSIKKEIKALQSEEKLLIQSRNAQLLNIVGALMGIAATVLVLIGPQAIPLLAYYSLMALFVSGAIAFPILAIGYAAHSTNAKKHTATLAEILEQRDSLADRKPPPLFYAQALTEVLLLEDILSRGYSAGLLK
jgi:hypothetical protein